MISPTHLACLAPPADGLAGGEGPVVLEVTLNDQDYTASAVNFSYYAPVAVSSLSPQSGPVGGDTLVRLSGAFSEFGSSYNCSFALDEPPVPATREGPESLVCHAPPMQAGTRNVSSLSTRTTMPRARSYSRRTLRPSCWRSRPRRGRSAAPRASS